MCTFFFSKTRWVFGETSRTSSAFAASLFEVTGLALGSCNLEHQEHSIMFVQSSSFSVAWIRSVPKFKLEVYTSNRGCQTNIYAEGFSPLVRNCQGNLVTWVHSSKGFDFSLEPGTSSKTDELKDSLLPRIEEGNKALYKSPRAVFSSI